MNIMSENHLLSKCLMFPFSRILSPVSRLLSHVFCLTSPVSLLMSPFSRFLSHVICLTSPVAFLLSHVSLLTSSVSCLLSHISCLHLLSNVSCLMPKKYQTWTQLMPKSVLKLSTINTWKCAKIPKLFAINAGKCAKKASNYHLKVCHNFKIVNN